MVGIIDAMKNKVVEANRMNRDEVVCKKGYAIKMDTLGHKGVLGVIQLDFAGCHKDNETGITNHTFSADIYLQDMEASEATGKVCMYKFSTGGYFGVNNYEYDMFEGRPVKDYAKYLLQNFQTCSNQMYNMNMRITLDPVSKEELESVAKALDNREEYFDALYSADEDTDDLSIEDEDDEDDDYYEEDDYGDDDEDDEKDMRNMDDDCRLTMNN